MVNIGLLAVLSCYSLWKRRKVNRRVDPNHGELSTNTTTTTTTTNDTLKTDFSTSEGSGMSPELFMSGEKDSPATKVQKHLAKKHNKQIDQMIKKDWRNEEKYIKLLLLGPGEAGKSTLIKQMQIIHGDNLETQEKLDRIPYICQNIFDSMVAILVAMKNQFDIPLENMENARRAEDILNHSQVCDPQLSSKDILYSPFLSSPEFFSHIEHLWEDEGVKKAYSRSNEYQLLDCAAYFFDRVEYIKQADYIPTEQDVLRCRVMTTSIQETKFSAPYGATQHVNFKVLDVGGQQGERRKWITLFDRVTAVLFMTDVSSFDQTLREDSQTNRLLESLKVFHQVITTKYLRSVSVLTFMNKIDILKEKIERGADFEGCLETMKAEALKNSEDELCYSEYDRQIYKRLYDILVDNPYSSFKVTDQDRKTFAEAFPAPETCQNNNNNNSMSLGKKLSNRLLTKKTSNSSLYMEIDDEVVKAAAYINMLLKEIKDRHHGSLHYQDNEFRSYEFRYTCAVDKANIRKVIDGCKNIIVKEYLARMGIPLP